MLLKGGSPGVRASVIGLTGKGLFLQSDVMAKKFNTGGDEQHQRRKGESTSSGEKNLRPWGAELESKGNGKRAGGDDAP